MMKTNPFTIPARPRVKATALGAALVVTATLMSGPSGLATANAEPRKPGPSVADLATESLRVDSTRERIYFAMTDRFANGDPSNDKGGLSGDRYSTGFDDELKGFYNGGDIKGLTDKLDYIKNLGMTAVWITPPFLNDPVQQTGGPETASASYHGYWIRGFDKIDPHVGTEEQVKQFVKAAHDRGIKVLFDVVANHSSDAISFRENEYSYVESADKPYKDAQGNVFDPAEYADGSKVFPELSLEGSFPYTPYFGEEADATSKSPAFLNDMKNYHNRGNSTFKGESSVWGDFIGLDDIFTEKPEVVEGFTEIFKGYVRDYDVDGFRIDTFKHVNIEFWQQVLPKVKAYAAELGKPNFYIFGEAATEDPEQLAWWATEQKASSVLDFAFQHGAIHHVADGAPATTMADVFAEDDRYISEHGNAYNLATFLGNHDHGRVAYQLRQANPGTPDWAVVRRLNTLNALMYFSRGNPVHFYGDEQGFVGTGIDQLARESLFASKVPVYANEELLGRPGVTGAQDNYSELAPLYKQTQRISSVVDAHPALANGAQTTRHADSGPGIFAFSKIDAEQQVEYVVVVNNSWEKKTASIPTYSADMAFSQKYPAGNYTVESGADKKLTVTVPHMSVTVLKAGSKIAESKKAPEISLNAPGDAGVVTGRTHVTANVGGDGFNQVTFAVKVGDGDWQRIGTDDNPSYSVWYDTTDLPAGTPVSFQAVVMDNSGHKRVSREVKATVG